jgi:5-methylcytosine-specific restriction endonuclease McrA
LQTGRGKFPAPKALLEAARCDAAVEDQNSRRRNIISPRLRRAVLRRDGNVCQSPGCSHMQFLQIHHRVPMAQGGSTKLENLVTLCSSCHQALHEREENLGRSARDPTV